MNSRDQEIVRRMLKRNCRGLLAREIARKTKMDTPYVAQICRLDDKIIGEEKWSGATKKWKYDFCGDDDE